MSRRIAVAVASALALSLGACSEIDQTAKSEKIYAGKKDERAADGANFGGDKKKWEATLAQRNNSQNEYLRTDTKK
jgi:hypothetical protein